jgi:hypothetical protein
MQLHEIQTRFRDAVVDGERNGILPVLAGGSDLETRLAIHQRNYHATLTEALRTKFPATEWLLGTRFLTEAAGRFIREYPPQAPCIAEYGSEFPDYLQACAPDLLYVRDFARLEWFIGKAAIATDSQSVGSGLHYLRAGWPVDELMTAYLTDNVPDRFQLEPAAVWIEIRGARGEVQLNRLNELEERPL